MEICIERDSDFSQVDVGDLSFYAVEARYPDDFYIPTEKEAGESLEKAIKVKAFVFKKLNIKDSDIKSDLTSREDAEEAVE